MFDCPSLPRLVGCVLCCWGDLAVCVSTLVCFCKLGSLGSSFPEDSPDMEWCVGVRDLVRSLSEHVFSGVSGSLWLGDLSVVSDWFVNHSWYVGLYLGPFGSV